MKSSTLIRDARHQDAAALCAAAREVALMDDALFVSLPDEFQPGAFKARIDEATLGEGKYLVAERDGKLIAHACLFPMALKRLAHIVRLDMCVHAGYWHQGLGKTLLGQLLDWARETPALHEVELLVRSSNKPAVALYKQTGFFEEGRHRDRIRLADERFVDDISMAIFLNKPLSSDQYT